MNNCFYILLFLLFWFIGCSNDSDIVSEEEEVQLAIAEAVEKARLKKLNECQESILLEAQQVVDSLIARELRKMHSREQDRPKRFAKPGKPGSIQVIDTIPLEPLWQDSLSLFDSLFYIYFYEGVDSLQLDSFQLDSLFRDSLMRSEK